MEIEKIEKGVNPSIQVTVNKKVKLNTEVPFSEEISSEFPEGDNQ